MKDDLKRGKFLAQLRIKNNLKQSDLAKMINYSDKSISKWERGICFPKDSDVLIKLSEIFNVSVEELLSGEYSDIEGKEIPIFKNKFINTLYKFRIIFIVILIVIFLIFLIHYCFIIYINNSNNKNYLFNEFDNKINDSNLENFDYEEDNIDVFDESDISLNDQNLGTVNNINKVLLAEGFTYENNSYFKYINDDVIFRYYLEGNKINIFDNSVKDNLLILYGSFKYNTFYIEKGTLGEIEFFNFKTNEIINCDIEICDDYKDYAMYINYIKNILYN